MRGACNGVVRVGQARVRLGWVRSVSVVAPTT